MRKAKMSFQSGEVKKVIRTYAVEIQTSDKRDLEADAVTMKLRKAMGANCKFDSLYTITHISPYLRGQRRATPDVSSSEPPFPHLLPICEACCWRFVDLVCILDDRQGSGY